MKGVRFAPFLIVARSWRKIVARHDNLLLRPVQTDKNSLINPVLPWAIVANCSEEVRPGAAQSHLR
jgi:hypothetical protein